MNDAATFALIFNSQGAVAMTWEAATRCSCYDADTKQPQWGHVACGGLGAVFAAPVAIRALYRGQSRWQSRKGMGNIGLGDAQLTTPVAVKPGYVDDRIRDRFTVVSALGDLAAGRVFYPAAQAVPFIFGGAQRAWRVQVQGLDQANRTLPQP